MMEPATTTGGGDPHRGKGGLLEGPDHLRSDLRLIQRALRAGWPITEEIRKAGVADVTALALRTQDERVKLGAWKTIGLFDRINSNRERMLALLVRSEAPNELHQHVHIEAAVADKGRDAIRELLAQVRERRAVGQSGADSDGNGRASGNGQSK